MKWEHYAAGEYYLGYEGYRLWVLKESGGWKWFVYDSTENQVDSGGGRYTNLKCAKEDAVESVKKLLNSRKTEKG